MLDLNSIRVFESVARHSSLTDAARELNMAVSTVGRRLDALEEELGCRLLSRGTRHWVLTDAGESFAQHCSKALVAVQTGQDALNRYRLQPGGLVRLAAPSSICRALIAPRLGSLYAQHPYLRLALSPVDYPGPLENAGDFDITIRGFMPTENRAVVKLLGTSFFGFFASPAFLRTHGRPETVSDLLHMPLGIMRYALHLPSEYSMTPNNIVTASASDDGAITVKPALVSNDSHLMLEATLSGGVVSGLAHWIAKPHVDNGDLVHVLPSTGNAVPIYAVLPGVSGMPKKIRIVLEFLESAIGKDLGVRCVPQRDGGSSTLQRVHGPELPA